MHRIDAPGFAPGNLFTEGNPALSIPATEVSDDWLNDVQENIVQFLEAVGITPVKGTYTQLTDAINAAIGVGGTNIKLDPLLNVTADQVIAGLLFDKTVTKAALINFDIHRETDSSNEQETGVLLVTHDSKDDVWRLELMQSGFDDSGSTFNVVVGTGQVRVTTDDLTGTNYDGQLRITGVTKFAL
jgi:hypothetical protein